MLNVLVDLFDEARRRRRRRRRGRRRAKARTQHLHSLAQINARVYDGDDSDVAS